MDRVTIQRTALVIGIVFAVLGICGFVPMFTSNSQGTTLLFSALVVSPVQNILYGITGLAGIACSLSFTSAQRFFVIAGAVYGALTLIGFFQGDTILGIYPVNLSNNLLDYALAITGIIFGFWPLPKETNA